MADLPRARALLQDVLAEGRVFGIFGRDVYLLRQQALRINERYTVSDEGGKPILIVERPAHFIRNLLAAFGSFAAAGAWVVGLTCSASSAAR